MHLKEANDRRGVVFNKSKVHLAKIKDVMNNKDGQAVVGAKRKGTFSDHINNIEEAQTKWHSLLCWRFILNVFI